MKIKSLIIFFAISFIVIFLLYYFFNCKPKLRDLFLGEDESKKKKKTKKKKNQEVGELNYLVSKFGLKKDKLNWKSLAIWISLIDAFIISFVVFIIEFIDVAMIIKFVIAFILLFALIYALYEIYGRYLKNKQEKED